MELSPTPTPTTCTDIYICDYMPSPTHTHACLEIVGRLQSSILKGDIRFDKVQVWFGISVPSTQNMIPSRDYQHIYKIMKFDNIR
jgi:hypothetical protein